VSLLAVDMGSSSCKAVAFSEDGSPIVHSTQFYSAESQRPSWSEMSPEIFWRALLTVTQAITAQLTNDPVQVLAISSHGETFIPVDLQNHAIGPAILNADNRAVWEAKWIASTIGPARIFETTGLAAYSMYPLPKILWLRNHQPDVFSHALRFLSLPGYLLSRLGLPPCVDYSLASRFLAFDIRNRTWSSDILAACDLPADRFPTPVQAGTIVGELSARIATDLGLKAGTPVVLGGHDQPCAALGSGVLDAGRVSASLGTYECLVAASKNPALSAEAFAANLNSYCHVVPDRYVTLAYFPSGIMIDWFLRLLESPGEPGTLVSRTELRAALEAQTSSQPTGLCITPHLMGTCNPDFDPSATGVIAGIRPTTTHSDLYKGILEGIACEFASMAELLQRAAGVYHDVYISGGGGRSRLGLQLRAAMSNRSLHLMQCQEAVCLGTAILAAVAIGKSDSFTGAVQQMVRVSDTVAPDPSMAQTYKAQQMQYHLLYSSLAPLRRAQGTCDQGEP
jgi:xylulokinase